MKKPDITKQLAEIQAMESAAFRVGQFGRRLFQEHPVLASARLAAYVYGASPALLLDDQSRGSVEIDAWASALGIELSRELEPTTVPAASEWAGRESLSGRVEVDGVTIELRGLRLLTQEQWDAAHAEGEVSA